MNELMLQYPDLAPGYDFMEGGIASLNVNKNPAFKWWSVPPKKGPLSQGLKLKPKQVKKV